jgi:hypothetical protein
MKSIATPIIVGVLLMCFAQCNCGERNEAAKGLRIVHVPRRVWPGCKSAPEMDELFRSLRPGEEARVKLIFSDPKNSLLPPEVFKITRGSVYFCSKAGYFRLDSNGKVYSSPDGQQEVDVDSSITTPQGISEPSQEIEIDYRAIWNKKSSKLGLDLKFKKQPIQSEEDRGQYIGYIVVKLSQDFDGDVTGWRSCHGI